MIIVAIDPGNTHSALCVLTHATHGGGQIVSKPVRCIYAANEDVLRSVEQMNNGDSTHPCDYIDLLAVEMIASYGMPVGAEVFETCLWIGRFIQAWRGPHRLIYRLAVKQHLCHDSRAKDGNIRQALMDRYGSTREAAIGTKKNPGPLYGYSGDMWAALAVAITAAETKETL